MLTMTKRVSLEQRQVLFDYMKNHEDLARGRISGPDAIRRKYRLLSDLADILNALGSGAIKSPKKWLKCWQDWKSDVKSKYLKIKRARVCIGGGPKPVPLTILEKGLLQFFGLKMVEGVTEEPDPLQMSEASPPELVPPEPEVVGEPVECEPAHHKTKNDFLHSVLERQAAATEDVAAAMREMAAAMRHIAVALTRNIQDI